LGMGKTILIASIIAGIAIMLLLSTQTVYAPPQSPRAAFSFHGSTDNGFDVDGGGSWVKGGPGINAGGTFTGTDTGSGSGTMGSWKATALNPTVLCCAPNVSGPGIVVFTADFRGADGQTFSKKVVLAETLDFDGATGTQNFWVEDFGFGTAFDVRFP